MQRAISEYRAQNDWFAHFIEDKCEVDASYRESSGALYQAYRNYSIDTNEYVRGTADFYAALENGGFKRINPRGKRFFIGLRLKTDAEGFLV